MANCAHIWASSSLFNLYSNLFDNSIGQTMHLPLRNHWVYYLYYTCFYAVKKEGLIFLNGVGSEEQSIRTNGDVEGEDEDDGNVIIQQVSVREGNTYKN